MKIYLNFISYKYKYQLYVENMCGKVKLEKPLIFPEKWIPEKIIHVVEQSKNEIKINKSMKEK